jgi:hypothetical protein
LPASRSTTSSRTAVGSTGSNAAISARSVCVSCGRATWRSQRLQVTAEQQKFSISFPAPNDAGVRATRGVGRDPPLERLRGRARRPPAGASPPWRGTRRLPGNMTERLRPPDSAKVMLPRATVRYSSVAQRCLKHSRQFVFHVGLVFRGECGEYGVHAPSRFTEGKNLTLTDLTRVH